MTETLAFSSEDLRLLADQDFFRKKAVLSKKITHTLEALHAQLILETSNQVLLAPDGFNPQSVQFVKGEHLEDYPYQYLDFPRYYTRDAKFAFRSLFWWGHHVVFSLLVEGPLVTHYRRNFFTRFSEVANRQLCLSLSPSLWEWKTGAGLTMEITSQRRSELAAVMDRRSALKIGRYIPFEQSLTEPGTIIQEGIHAFRSILPLITA
ncbi:MAG TPA: hypothetical protein PKZ24_06685 [Nitrospirales bacterium]|nr:hypothetical protein [Nitrospirales bacterium]